MKKFFIIISSVIVLIWGVAVRAHNAIAVLDLNKVMMGAPQLEAAKNKLKKQFEPREKELETAQKAFQADIESFNKDSATMKESDKKAKQQKIIEQQKKLQEMQSKFQNDLNVAQSNAMQEIVKTVEGIVKKIALDKKLDVVLAKAGTVYSKPELEITDDVVKQMKK